MPQFSPHPSASENEGEGAYPDTQSSRSRFSSVGSSYLKDVGQDFGGARAQELGQKAAQRYLENQDWERTPILDNIKSRAQAVGRYAALTSEVLRDTIFPRQLG